MDKKSNDIFIEDIKKSFSINMDLDLFFDFIRQGLEPSELKEFEGKGGHELVKAWLEKNTRFAMILGNIQERMLPKAYTKIEVFAMLMPSLTKNLYTLGEFHDVDTSRVSTEDNKKRGEQLLDHIDNAISKSIPNKILYTLYKKMYQSRYKTLVIATTFREFLLEECGVCSWDDSLVDVFEETLFNKIILKAMHPFYYKRKKDFFFVIKLDRFDLHGTINFVGIP